MKLENALEHVRVVLAEAYTEKPPRSFFQIERAVKGILREIPIEKSEANREDYRRLCQDAALDVSHALFAHRAEQAFENPTREGLTEMVKHRIVWELADQAGRDVDLPVPLSSNGHPIFDLHSTFLLKVGDEAHRLDPYLRATDETLMKALGIPEDRAQAFFEETRFASFIDDRAAAWEESTRAGCAFDDDPENAEVLDWIGEMRDLYFKKGGLEFVAERELNKILDADPELARRLEQEADYEPAAPGREAEATTAFAPSP